MSLIYNKILDEVQSMYPIISENRFNTIWKMGIKYKWRNPLPSFHENHIIWTNIDYRVYTYICKKYK